MSCNVRKTLCIIYEFTFRPFTRIVLRIDVHAPSEQNAEGKTGEVRGDASFVGYVIP